MNILFTICGRAGSKGFKNKNLKKMSGVPLSFYSLAAIYQFMKKHSEDNITVALNTDSSQLMELIQSQTFIPVRCVYRKQELAGDNVPKVEVIKDTYFTCEDSAPDVVIDLDITSPMRRLEDIDNIVSEYSKGLYDLVFSVVEARRSPYFNMVESKQDGFYRKICESNYTTRQQAPKAYEMNASIYAYSPAFLRRNITKTIIEYKCGISVMPDYLVLDIDSEKDFVVMESLYKYFCKNDVGLMSIYKCAIDIGDSYNGNK